MSNSPKFSIITACRARLDHLKQTLPAMLRQIDAEVIVVDFSCPQGTAAYLSAHHPEVVIAKVEGKDYWSQTEARNAAAAKAQGEWLVFCDADTILSEVCTKWLGENLKPGEFGKFQKAQQLVHHRASPTPLSANSLQGFQVVERSTWGKLGGYDHRLRGYAAGSDTEFFRRATLAGCRAHFLSETIIADVIHHDDEARYSQTKEYWLGSYLRGVFYGRLKMCFDLLTGRPPADAVCDQLIEASAGAADKVLSSGKSMDVTMVVEKHALPLASIEGYPDAAVEIVLTIRVNLSKEREEVKEMLPQGLT